MTPCFRIHTPPCFEQRREDTLPPQRPEALRERVFEPFFRRDGHAEGIDGGVGLGLALVQQIAHFHGGAARMVDDGGRTRVEVDLP